MRKITQLNDHWLFKDGHREEVITLPHSAVEMPFDCMDEKAYQHDFSYTRWLFFEQLPEQEVYLRFDGVMADARVLFNGTEIAQHTDGYTPFEARLSLSNRAITIWRSH